MVKPLGIWVEMVAQNTVSTPGNEEVWGKYASMFSLCFILSFILDLGLGQLLTKKIANDSLANQEHSGTGLSLKIISALLYPFIILTIGYTIGYRSSFELYLLISVSLIHVGIQFFNFFRGVVHGNQLFKADALLSNLDKALLILLVCILMITGLTIENFVYARIASVFFAVVVVIIILKKNELFFKPLYNKKLAKNLIKQGMPFAFITLVYSVNEQVDQVMVERLSTTNPLFDEAGVYSAAYRIVNGIMMYLWIVLPIFFAKFAHRNTTSRDTQKLLKTGTSIVFLPIAFISICFISHGYLFFDFFFDQLNDSSTKAMSFVFSILCLTLLLQGLFAILSTYLTSTGHEKKVTILVTISVAFNLISNFFFVPYYGAEAAAWTTLGSAIIVIVGYIILILMNTTLTLPYLTWLKLTLTAGSLYLVLNYSSNLKPLYSILLGGVAFVLSVVILRPIRLKELKSIP